MSDYLIDDSNWQEHADPDRPHGGEVRSFAAIQPRRTPYCGFPGAVAVGDVFDPIPESDWKRLILEGQGAFLSDLCKDAGQKVKNQKNSNYCWSFSGVSAIESARIMMAQPYVELSAWYLGIKVRGGSNQGGYPEETLDFARQYGVPEDRLVTNVSIGRSVSATFAPNIEADAAEHKILRWFDVRSWEDQITLALHRVPVELGLGWWSHAIVQLDPVILSNGEVGILCRNSWGPDYPAKGQDGWFTLTRSRGTADLGAFGPCTINLDPTP